MGELAEARRFASGGKEPPNEFASIIEFVVEQGLVFTIFVNGCDERGDVAGGFFRMTLLFFPGEIADLIAVDKEFVACEDDVSLAKLNGVGACGWFRSRCMFIQRQKPTGNISNTMLEESRGIQ